MAKLIYSAIASLDGYTADPEGGFEWAAPDPEVHAFINDLERPIGTYLYGRRMYQVMSRWQNMLSGEQTAEVRTYAEIWRSADKIVFSRTLDAVSTPKTRLQREFGAETVRSMIAGADRPVSIGGPELAGQALLTELVDEIHVFVVPFVVGAGTRWLPDGLRQPLALVAERRFRNGTVYLKYRTAAGRTAETGE